MYGKKTQRYTDKWMEIDERMESRMDKLIVRNM